MCSSALIIALSNLKINYVSLEPIKIHKPERSEIIK